MLMTAREPHRLGGELPCRVRPQRTSPTRSGTGPSSAGAARTWRSTDRDWGLYTARGGALFADRIVDRPRRGSLRERGRASCGRHTRVAEDRPGGATSPSRRRRAHRPPIADRGRRRAAGRASCCPSWRRCCSPSGAIVIYLEPPAGPGSRAGSRAPCLLDFGRLPATSICSRPWTGSPLKFGDGSTSFPADPDEPRALRDDEPERLLACLRPYLRDFDRYRVVDHRICMYCFSPDERFVAGTLAGGRVAYATGLLRPDVQVRRRHGRAARGRRDGRARRRRRCAAGRWASTCARGLNRGRTANADRDSVWPSSASCCQPVETPVANYVERGPTGNLLFLSGRGPTRRVAPCTPASSGRRSRSRRPTATRRVTGLQLIAIMKAELGDLDRVSAIVKVLGMVNAVPGVRRPAQGDQRLLGPVRRGVRRPGRHARSAVGMGSLPRNITVEIEAIVEVS